jgi:hypothetical protein
MNVNFTRYNENGVILETGNMPEDGLQFLVAEQGWTYIEGIFDAATQIVDVVTREVTARPTLDIPSEVSIILGQSVSYTVPPNTVVFMSGDVYPVTDGDLTITPDSTGVFALKIQCSPYSSVTLKVTVNGA